MQSSLDLIGYLLLVNKKDLFFGWVYIWIYISRQ